MTLALGIYITAMNISWTHFGANLGADVAASDPAWMIVIGLSLFGVRALIARPDDPNRDASSFNELEPEHSRISKVLSSTQSITAGSSLPSIRNTAARAQTKPPVPRILQVRLLSLQAYQGPKTARSAHTIPQ